MPNYNVSNTLGGTQQALSTSFKTLANIYAQTASLRRGKLGTWACADHRAELQLQIERQHHTADGDDQAKHDDPDIQGRLL